MRNLMMIVVALTFFLPAGAALADEDVGCGLGTILWEGQTGPAPKILAATTNGSFGNQTFGISSGTLGCQQGGTVTASARLSMFASANLGALQAQMAAGHGEDLNVLANLYGIQSQSDKQAFFSMAQRHFSQIFSSKQVTTGQVLASIRHYMTENPQLSGYVAST